MRVTGPITRCMGAHLPAPLGHTNCNLTWPDWSEVKWQRDYVPDNTPQYLPGTMQHVVPLSWLPCPPPIPRRTFYFLQKRIRYRDISIESYIAGRMGRSAYPNTDPWKRSKREKKKEKKKDVWLLPLIINSPGSMVLVRNVTNCLGTWVLECWLVKTLPVSGLDRG